MSDQDSQSGDSRPPRPPHEPPENRMWEVVNDESEDSPEEGGMSFLDHLEELRWTLVKCAAAFLVACVLIGVFVFQFADLLRWPYDFAMAKFDGVEDRLFVRGFMGAFSVMFQLFFLGGLCLSLPAMLYFLGKFVSPGMTASERKVLGPASAAAVVLFLSGASFSFFILLPAGLSASIYFSIQFGFDLLIDAASYYSLLLWATMGVGAAFEFPLLLLLLIHLGILGTEKLVTYRRHAIVGFLVLSAVVTPTPDPITFLFLAVPLQVLYEISIIVGRWVEKKREERMKILDVD